MSGRLGSGKEEEAQVKTKMAPRPASLTQSYNFQKSQLCDQQDSEHMMCTLGIKCPSWWLQQDQDETSQGKASEDCSNPGCVISQKSHYNFSRNKVPTGVALEQGLMSPRLALNSNSPAVTSQVLELLHHRLVYVMLRIGRGQASTQSTQLPSRPALISLPERSRTRSETIQRCENADWLISVPTPRGPEDCFPASLIERGGRSQLTFRRGTGGLCICRRVEHKGAVWKFGRLFQTDSP